MNWKVRLNNPLWYVQMGLAILLPILGYFGLTAEDITSWGIFFDTLTQAVSNPFVWVLVVSSVVNACNDPTTKGLKDGELAKTYIKPSVKK